MKDEEIWFWGIFIGLGLTTGTFILICLIDPAIGIQPDTLDNVCKTIAGNDTKFLKISWTLDEYGEYNKQVIECTKISPQKVFDDGSIVLK
jgi:hypothetical protein